MRAVAAAICLFLLNIIGMGFGPLQGVGILSDYLSADYGKESLRYSLLMVFSLINVWCAFHYFHQCANGLVSWVLEIP